jgi:hypothetical protein
VGLPVIALAATAIGTGISAIGAIQSSGAQAANANYAAQVARNNATVAQQKVQLAAQIGQAKAEATSLTTRASGASILAAQSASGIDVGSPSSVDVRTTHREMGRLAAQTDQYNAALRQYGYRLDASSYQGESALDTATAQQASIAGPLAAAGSLIGGAGTAVNRFSWMQSNAGNVLAP